MQTQNDGELFLIKHLLILREQIAPFNNEFSSVELQLDFTKIKDAAFGLMQKKDKFFRLNRDNAFLDFLLHVKHHKILLFSIIALLILIIEGHFASQRKPDRFEKRNRHDTKVFLREIH